jgi:hypothetical protein
MKKHRSTVIPFSVIQLYFIMKITAILQYLNSIMDIKNYFIS